MSTYSKAKKVNNLKMTIIQKMRSYCKHFTLKKEGKYFHVSLNKS